MLGEPNVMVLLDPGGILLLRRNYPVVVRSAVPGGREAGWVQS
jgi:hypothetical protein